jgi:two-component system cell cycle response regulator
MAHTGRQGLDLAAKVKPDLILVDFQLPDFTGVDLCARLRQIPTVRPSTPILLFSAGAAGRLHRLDAYRAGAWGVLDPPFDPRELLTRIVPLIQAKRDADTAIEASDLDPLTGFYNVHGLMRRLTEIGADTRRSQRPLACVVLSPSGPRSASIDASSGGASQEGSLYAANEEVAQKLGHIIHTATRSSDAVARIGTTDFVIVAPGTDRNGAIRLAERVVDLLEKTEYNNDHIRSLKLQAGLSAVSGRPDDLVVPEEVLRRATSALSDVRSADRSRAHGSRIFPFDLN